MSALIWTDMRHGGVEARLNGVVRLAVSWLGSTRGLQPTVRLFVKDVAEGEGAGAESFDAAKPMAVTMARKLIAEQVALLQGADALLAAAEAEAVGLMPGARVIAKLDDGREVASQVEEVSTDNVVVAGLGARPRGSVRVEPNCHPRWTCIHGCGHAVRAAGATCGPFMSGRCEGPKKGPKR